MGHSNFAIRARFCSQASFVLVSVVGLLDGIVLDYWSDKTRHFKMIKVLIRDALVSNFHAMNIVG